MPCTNVNTLLCCMWMQMHDYRCYTKNTAFAPVLLEANKSTPTAVLEAEASIPSTRIALDDAVLRMQAWRGIQRNLCKKKRGKHGGKREQTPVEEKEK